ncbi:MAG: glycosyltransferase family 2 protein [Patescibacteria group bacterium]|jgi:GT2 family glycosyltransferase
MIKVIVGFIIYNNHTAKYLPDFLGSLKNQTTQNFKIVAFNNGDEDGSNLEYIKNNFPEIEILGTGENIGFARAYNQMIKKAVNDGADYFFITNPDIVYNSNVLEKLVERLNSNMELGAVCPKLLRWDFDKKIKTGFIDSLGLNLKTGLKFYDVGQGEKDSALFSQEKIIGPGGASGLWRIKTLEKIKEGENYFDERMFMYKEDCDLTYRLHLSGDKAKFVSEAIGWHDRTVAIFGKGDLAVILARAKKSPLVRCWSVINQEILFKKYWSLQSWQSKLAITIYRLKVFVWIIFAERFLLKEYLTIKKIKSNLNCFKKD